MTAEDDVLEALQERDEAEAKLAKADDRHDELVVEIRRWRELAAIRLQRIEELEKELVKAQRFAQRLLDTHPDHMPSRPRPSRARMAGEDADAYTLAAEEGLL